jgi:hypothetical protein
MRMLTGSLGIVILSAVIADSFQTVIVARHAHKIPGLTRLFYRVSWAFFSAAARVFTLKRRREIYLGIYGPLSLLILLALWALGFIVAFGLIQWAAGLQRDGFFSSIASDMYFSAATFFTLGTGAPQKLASKYLMVLEAGFGFSFLGLVIGYLPVLYQSFSNRELRVLMLDARAGSPPSATQFVLRGGEDCGRLEERLARWEEWALDLLNTNLSYPMLAYYRSLHANQSWLAALTAIVDASALIMLTSENGLKRQAEFTFAAGRHALAHTASLFPTPTRRSHKDRLPVDAFAQVCAALSAGRAPLQLERISELELRKLRAAYEHHAIALGAYFLMSLPPWIPTAQALDNWQGTSWEP